MTNKIQLENDIQKMTLVDELIQSNPDVTGQPVDESNRSSEQDIEKDELSQKLKLSVTIVFHSYLNHLSELECKNPKEEKLSMTWYQITKIVLDKEKFFPDQLSMLYTALHNVAENVALVIEKKDNEFNIYIGARDLYEHSPELKNAHESGQILNAAIQGYLPGIKVKVVHHENDPLLKKNDSQKHVASYSGIASLRDDKKDSFIQGLERFIDATSSIPSFTAILIADRVGQVQAQNIIQAYSTFEDLFRPLMENQYIISKSLSKGITKTINNAISQTIAETLDKTIAKTEGKGYNETTNYSPNIIETTLNRILGGITSISKQEGLHKADMNYQSEADSKSLNLTEGTSIQITYTNTLIKNYVNLLERYIQRLQNGTSFGLWSIGTYFVSGDLSTSRQLANIYRGYITGEYSDLDTNAVNTWDRDKSEKLLEYLRNAQNPLFSLDNITVSATEIVTSKELAIHMSMPQTSIPGVEVRESAVFGRNIKPLSNETITIGKIAHLGNVSTKEVVLDLEELSKHVFVTGSTGSGKSNTVYLLINEILKKQEKKVRFLVVEPVKGDYRKVFGGREDVTVYGTREDEKNLLRINPFAFPDGTTVIEHVERLVEIFGVCWPMYAAMPAVLKSSILSAYETCGWDLKKSKCRFESDLFPTISDVVTQLKRIISSSQYSSDTKSDYIGALQTRLESLTNGVYASMLSSQAIPYTDLYDRNAIIDLHRIGSVETRSLLMGLIILGLNEWRMSQGEELMNQKLHHVTVLEEAHCILPRVSKQQYQEGANMVGKSVEMIATAIAEMRTYGECFIIVDQSPSAVDEAAIRNTNTKIVMNLPDGNDRIIAGKSVALTKDNQIDELARLSVGEAIVWQRGWSDAVMARIDEMKERTPLLPKDNCKEDKTDSLIKPSNLFIQCFIFNNVSSMTNEERKILVREIHKANVYSTLKAKLIDYVEKRGRDTLALREYILDYLGIRYKLCSLFENYPNGSAEIIWELRIDMATRIEIYDTKIQNKLLQIGFEWASSQNAKWQDICTKSVNLIQNKFSLC